MIRNMQFLGVTAILLCVLAMFLIYERQGLAARWVFGAGMVSLMASLLFSLREIVVSVNALNLLLADLETGKEQVSPVATDSHDPPPAM